MWPELSAGPLHAWAELEQGLHAGQSTTCLPHPALTHTAVSSSLGPVLLSLSEPWLLLCSGSSPVKEAFSGVGIGFVVGGCHVAGAYGGPSCITASHGLLCASLSTSVPESAPSPNCLLNPASLVEQLRHQGLCQCSPVN